MIIRKQQLLYWTLQEHFTKEMYAKAWSKIKDGNNRRPRDIRRHNRIPAKLHQKQEYLEVLA